ncbi:MAG: hypothetical protein OET44_00930 [Gammaproteobacteria bacterium]|nr:hypothetical protein [Gammaproteobacteria bacterium]
MPQANKQAVDEPVDTTRIAAYLAGCRELARFCTQNGWIDNQSIDFEIQKRAACELLVAIKFTEVIMKGAGCEARRMPCFARLRLHTDGRGEIVAATPA